MGAICSVENPALERNPGLKYTRTDAIFKKFNVKTNVKLKINVIWNFRSIQQNHH
jgi:hypothetical protein